MEDLKIDLFKGPLEREDLIGIAKIIGVVLSPFQAHEALFYAR